MPHTLSRTWRVPSSPLVLITSFFSTSWCLLTQRQTHWPSSLTRFSPRADAGLAVPCPRHCSHFSYLAPGESGTAPLHQVSLIQPWGLRSRDPASSYTSASVPALFSRHHFDSCRCYRPAQHRSWSQARFQACSSISRTGESVDYFRIPQFSSYLLLAFTPSLFPLLAFSASCS